MVFTDVKDVAEYSKKADKYRLKAEKLKYKSQKIKSELYKNEKTSAIFKSGINEIDRALVSSGKNKVNKLIK